MGNAISTKQASRGYYIPWGIFASEQEIAPLSEYIVNACDIMKSMNMNKPRFDRNDVVKYSNQISIPEFDAHVLLTNIYELKDDINKGKETNHVYFPSWSKGNGSWAAKLNWTDTTVLQCRINGFINISFNDIKLAHFVNNQTWVCEYSQTTGMTRARINMDTGEIELKANLLKVPKMKFAGRPKGKK